MAGPFTTPVAFSTPFLSEPERTNGFQSKNVQEAIEEALALAISNDKFLTLAQYNGNANAGRLLEFFGGIDSEDAPLHFTSQSRIVSIVCSTTNPNSSALIAFYDIIADPGLTTPLYTLDMDGLKTKIDNGLTLFTMPAGGAMAIQVFSGSIGKPHLQVTFSSSI